MGNRLAMGADGEVITYTYDAVNRLTGVDNVEYSWDNNCHTDAQRRGVGSDGAGTAGAPIRVRQRLVYYL